MLSSGERIPPVRTIWGHRWTVGETWNSEDSAVYVIYGFVSSNCQEMPYLSSNQANS